MSSCITRRLTPITHHSHTLFSLHVRAPVLPLTAGQFAQLGLEFDCERTQRAHSC
ncbi:ferredoxin--NADP(+) reductase, partial [Morganella morganii]|nr:ferredoxin--NADP(+) reductase [Morganella morganii]